MYESYWGLCRSPFGGGPLDFFYESSVHEEAAARLWYLVECRRRCGLLTGPAGTGKTALLAVLADQLTRSGCRVVRVDVGGLSGDEFRWRLNGELGMFPGADDSQLLLWRKVQDSLEGMRAARLATVFVFDHVDQAGDDCRGPLRRLIQFQPHLRVAATILLAGRDCPEWRPLADLRVELNRLDFAQTQS